MFIACPHCRYLVATDPRTQAPPAQCSRCGGALAESAAPSTPSAASPAPGQSFASLLRRDEAPAPPVDEVPSAPIDAEAHAPTEDDIAVEDVASDDAHPEPPATAVIETPVTVDDLAAPADDLAQDSPSPVVDEPAKTHEETAAALAGAVVAVQRTTSRAPGFLRAGAARPASARGIPRWQGVSVAVLLLALGVQILIADRARLASDAGWRPIVVNVCNLAGCDVPPWREPQAFVMLDRDVRPLPGAPGVLQARATFRNDARWAQPWPVLLLTLKDADGRSLGARAIAPADYLRGGTANRELAPGQSAQVAVRIREPSASVVAFSFDFR